MALKSPISRVIANAIIVGIMAFGTAMDPVVRSGQPVSWSALYGAGAAAFWAVLQVFTPLNRSVGVGVR